MPHFKDFSVPLPEARKYRVAQRTEKFAPLVISCAGTALMASIGFSGNYSSPMWLIILMMFCMVIVTLIGINAKRMMNRSVNRRVRKVMRDRTGIEVPKTFHILETSRVIPVEKEDGTSFSVVIELKDDTMMVTTSRSAL